MFHITRPGSVFAPCTWSCGPTMTPPVPSCHPVKPPSLHAGSPNTFV